MTAGKATDNRNRTLQSIPTIDSNNRFQQSIPTIDGGNPYKCVAISLCHATSYYMCKTPTSQVAYNHNQNSVVNYMHCASTLGPGTAFSVDK